MTSEGSGHILTYAFDLLYAIYEEQGYDPVRIPQYILQKNLYGIEIDKRAAMLSSFALMMKARAKDKRFFNRGIKPNILEMEDVRFEPAEIKAYLDKLGRDLYTQDLWEGLQQFENAKTFGSLIRPAIKDVPTLRERMRETRVSEDLLLNPTNNKLEKVLEMSEYLSPRYQVVVANPPYFSKGMDAEFKQFAQENYADSKADTLSMFIERNLDLSKKGGYVGMITLMSWMFLSSFEKLREKLLSDDTLLNMAHLGARAFDTIGGEVVSTTMFTLRNVYQDQHGGEYFRLIDGMSEAEKQSALREALANPNCGWFYRATAQDFTKIPGAPIAYWVSQNIYRLFEKTSNIGEYFDFQIGLVTGNNEQYVRNWFEVCYKKIGFGYNSRITSKSSLKKWFPYAKGGEYRKWCGNYVELINWENDGFVIQNRLDPSGKRIWAHNFNLDKIFNPSLSWNTIGSNTNSFRYFSVGFLFDAAGGLCQPKSNASLFEGLGLLNSKISEYLAPIINPTISNHPGYIGKIPFIGIDNDVLISKLVEISQADWDSSEISWHFLISPLLEDSTNLLFSRLSERYAVVRSDWLSKSQVAQSLEEENNRNLLDAYGLQDELTPEVPLEMITLTCNPHYRYKGNLTDEEREARLLQDTMKEFLSYAVGCMFGRYSLDKPGLILANQGETLQDYLRIIGKEPIFTPTETNVIPILDGDWFADDVTARFKQFLKITFGEPNYEENLRFIEDALGKDLRKYFLKDFYKDHVQTYKKRPIYWLFSSPKGSFNALIYMHRYQPNTVSVVLNQYLREYREKLNAQRRYQESLSISPSSSQREKTAALKEIESLSKILAELKTYEDEVLFPLAGEQIELDLDDGVVVNYAKFGDALRRI